MKSIEVDAHDFFYSRLIEQPFVAVYTPFGAVKKRVTKIDVERHPEYVYVLTTSVGNLRIDARHGSSKLYIVFDAEAMYKHYLELQEGFRLLYSAIGYIDGNDSSMNEYGEWVWENKSVHRLGVDIPAFDSVAQNHLGYTNEWYQFEKYK